MAHWYPLAVSLWIFGLEKTCHLNVPLLGSLIWFISYAAEKNGAFSRSVNEGLHERPAI